MFKNLKKKIEKWLHANKEDNVIRIKLGDVKFTPFKRKYPSFTTNNLSWTEEQVKLRESIKNGNFDNTKNLPTVSIDNVWIDGHHRAVSLLETYGPNYEINVYKLKHKYIKVFWVSVFYYIFFQSKK